MAFTPITANQPISYAISRTAYRNSARENLAGGTPVFYTPKDWPAGTYGGYGGPRYKEGYTYYNCPSPESTYNGNCTWWCWGRAYEALGISLPTLGDGGNWYNNYSGTKSTNVNNLRAGDIICLSDGGYGHVMFVESISGSTVTISQSAYSQRSIWSGRACMVNTYSLAELSAGRSVDMYRGVDTAYYYTVVGYLHIGGSGPTPPGPSATPSVSVSPSSASITVDEYSTYADVTFTISVTGIPESQDASNAISFSSNCYRYAYTTNWVYTNYTYGGNTYRAGTRSLIVRYDRLHDYSYTDTAYMYYIKTFTNGSVNSTTPIQVTIKAKATGDDVMDSVYPFLINARKKLGKVKFKIKR